MFLPRQSPSDKERAYTQTDLSSPSRPNPADANIRRPSRLNPNDKRQLITLLFAQHQLELDTKPKRHRHLAEAGRTPSSLAPSIPRGPRPTPKHLRQGCTFPIPSHPRAARYPNRLHSAQVALAFSSWAVVPPDKPGVKGRKGPLRRAESRFPPTHPPISTPPETTTAGVLTSAYHS